MQSDSTAPSRPNVLAQVAADTTDYHFPIIIADSFAEFPGMGHGLDSTLSQLAWLESIRKHQHGAFDKEFLERVLVWLQSVLQQPTTLRR